MEYTITYKSNNHNISVKATHNKTNTCYESSIQNNDIYRYVLNNINNIRVTFFVIEDKLYIQCKICTISLEKKDIISSNKFIIQKCCNDIKNDNRQIYIDGKNEYIKDILYSASNINKNEINKLSQDLDNIYNITVLMQNDINDKINELEMITFDLMHFGEPDNNYNDKPFNIIPLFKKVELLNFNTIIKYIYDYELNAISRLVPNHIINIHNNMTILKETKPIEYISKNTIISRFSKSIKNDINKMEKLKQMIIENIYNDYICKNNFNNISETKLRALYSCFDIEAIKLLNDTNTLLNSPYNVLIPMSCINI